MQNSFRALLRNMGRWKFRGKGVLLSEGFLIFVFQFDTLILKIALVGWKIVFSLQKNILIVSPLLFIHTKTSYIQDIRLCNGGQCKSSHTCSLSDMFVRFSCLFVIRWSPRTSISNQTAFVDRLSKCEICFHKFKFLIIPSFLHGNLSRDQNN